MKKFLVLAEYGSFMKILFTNDRNSKDLIEEVGSTIDQCPYETFEIPTGTCKVYKQDKTWIAVTNNIVVEMLEDETDIEVHFDFADKVDDNFRDIVYLAICYILGYIIYRDEKIYKQLLMPYVSKISHENGTNFIRFDRYRQFTDNEEWINNIRDHISVQDIIFNTNLKSYIETEDTINTTVIDITDLKNIFKVKDIFFID